MNISVTQLVAVLSIPLLLCACPGKIDPGNPQGSNLGKASSSWGLPMIRILTAGFNGVPSETNNAGPADTKEPAKEVQK